MIITNKETGHFLTEDQKKVKQKMMEDCLDGIWKNLHENQNLFPEIQSVLDLVFSIQVMWNREVLCHIMKIIPETVPKRKQIMKDLFETIRDEVNRKILGVKYNA
jgi:hypothetical protein